MIGWHHQLNGHEFEQTLGDGEGQGSLACCSPWGRKESDMTEWLNNKEVIDSLLSTEMKIFWRIDFCSDKSYPLFLRPDNNRLYLWFDKACYYLLIASLTTCLYANFNISVSRSVVSDSLWPHGLQPTGLLSVHEIFQARILEWVAISFSRRSSQPRDRTWVSCTAGRSFSNRATREAPYSYFNVRTNNLPFVFFRIKILKNIEWMTMT